jgi:hypothetical protein
MLTISTRSSRRRSVVVMALLVGALLSAVLAQEATAGLRACRADPIVWLSNGQAVQMSVGVAAPAYDVHQITYILHVPRGTTVRKIVYTGGALSSKERVYVIPDMPLSRYRIDTLVAARGYGISVTALGHMKGEGRLSARGVSGKYLTMYFNLGR